MNNHKLKHFLIWSILLFVVFINVLILIFSPTKIVDLIGSGNSYIIILITASLGGVSAVTGAALFTTIVAFSAGGINPLVLGLAGGLGIFIGDSIFYHLVVGGRKVLPEKWNLKVSRATSWIRNHPTWLVLGFIYFYIGFTPLPADILLAALALAGYSYRKILPALFMGSITVAMFVSYLGHLWTW